MFNRFLMLLLSNVISLVMAQIKRGILGGIQGKVGHLSGQVSKGRNVLTLKPDMSKVAKTTPQVVNNNKFNVLRKLYLYSNEIINKTVCSNNSYKEAGYNFFSRKNYDNLTFDNIVSVDNLFIGNSGLPRVQILTAKYNSAHTSMTVTYSTSTFNVYGTSSKTYCCLYDATNIILYCLPTNYNFFSGTFVIDLPVNHIFDFNSLYVSVIASSNTDSKKFSNTLNNWLLSEPAVSNFNFIVDSLYFSNTFPCIELIEGVHVTGSVKLPYGYSISSSSRIYKCLDNRVFMFPYNIFNSSDIIVTQSYTIDSNTTSVLCTFQKSLNYDLIGKLLRTPVVVYSHLSYSLLRIDTIFGVYTAGRLAALGSSDVSFINVYKQVNYLYFDVSNNSSSSSRYGIVTFQLQNRWYDLKGVVIQDCL